MYSDFYGLATDGEPLNRLNCEALNKLVKYEEVYGKWNTMNKYNTFNFSSDMTDLDGAFPSEGGQVSIDWMMRSAGPLGSSSLPGISYVAYGIEKSWWNIINGTYPWTNLAGEANSNGPSALSAWLYGDKTLAQMFSASLEQCDCED